MFQSKPPKMFQSKPPKIVLPVLFEPNVTQSLKPSFKLITKKMKTMSNPNSQNLTLSQPPSQPPTFSSNN